MKKLNLPVLLFSAFLLAACQNTGSTKASSKKEETKQEETKKEETKQNKTSEDVKKDSSVSFSYPEIPADKYPKIDGSTATLPLSYAIYRLATGESEDSAIGKIVHNKTTGSYYKLFDKEADIILAYAPPQDLMDAIKETEGTKSVKYERKSDSSSEEIEIPPILIKPVGKDALVFLANKSNPVNDISGENIVKIYSGEIENWKELGGNDNKIKAFQRPRNSGSQNLMEKLVMKDKKLTDPYPELVATEMGDLIEAVAAYDNSADAIGYSVYYYAKNMKNDPSVKFLSIDKTMPDDESIRKGEYPYTNEFYVAIRADSKKDSYEYKIFEWLTGDDGQALVNHLGYVGVEDSKDKQKEEEIKELLK